MEIVIISLYIFFLTFILLHSISEMNLLFSYWFDRRKHKGNKPKKFIDGKRPMVTIQLPVYNERYVIERLIDTVAQFNWPKDKLHIQVLDDSTDDTIDIIAEKVIGLLELGFDIEHVRRKERKGYKAGALAYGMKEAKGEFIAIFDADFIPDENFLNKTIPYFEDIKIGVVQTKWGHINEGYSLLTRLQAFALNAHFKIEQRGRNYGGHFINFNGTAGVWRKECIQDAGGWQSDTLTEDLDLSYRAQLKGWKFQYLEEVESPAELPVTMPALKNQQFRWSKGAAECTRKNLGKVLMKKGLGWKTKVNAVFHLLNSFLFVCVVSLVILSVPMLFVIENHPQYIFIKNVLSFFLISTIILGLFYFVANKKKSENYWVFLLKFIMFFPVFLALTMGIALYNAIGVIEGYLGRKTPFVRTPKFNVNAKGDIWKQNKYSRTSLNPVVIFEILISLYAIYGVFIAFSFENYFMLIFLIMIAIGFSYTSFYTVKHALYTK